MTVDSSSSLQFRVGDLERARAEAYLQEAYSAGRLNEAELDQRLGMAMTAVTRRDLNAALAGLPPRMMMAAQQSAVARNPQSTGLGAFAHFSALFTWIFGPLLAYAVASPGTPARRHAARAFNFQVITAIVFVATVVLEVATGGLVPDLVYLIGWLGWVSLSIVGGARALSGQPWVNPVLRVIRWEAIDSSGR